MALSLVSNNPSAIGGKVAASANRLADSQETFLKLLTTQLKNQDPLSPLDANQFTAQIVQMTGVEQQIYSNQLLEQLVNQGGAGLQSSVGLIGKTVAVIGDSNTLMNGKAAWAYDLAADASDVDLEIVDSTGRLVWSGKAEDGAAGRHPFAWDGKDLAGAQRADGGEYRLIVNAHDSAGKAVDSITYFTGVATAVEANAGQTILFVGRTRALLSSLVGVTA